MINKNKLKIVILFLVLLGSCDLFITDVETPYSKVIIELASSRSLSDDISLWEVLVTGKNIDQLKFTQAVGSTFSHSITSGDDIKFTINLYNSDSSLLLFTGSKTVDLKPDETKQLDVDVYQSARQLVYNGNGSIVGSVPATSYYNDNSIVTIIGNTGLLQKTGYNFSGWNTLANGSGTTYDVDSTLTLSGSGVTLYAIWTSSTYTVTYNLNGGEGTLPSDANNYLQGATVILNDGTDLIKLGYSFSGWSIESSGDLISSSYYIMPGNKVTFYAIWAANTYSIIFSGNGTDGGTMAEQTVLYDETVTLIGNSFTNSDTELFFSGWTIKDDGSGTLYQDGSSYTHTTASTITLYAKWVSFSLQEGMVAILGGTYTQTDLDGYTFEHTISNYSIGQYEVTYNLYYTVYQWAIANNYTFPLSGQGQEGTAGILGEEPTSDNTQPATNMHWMDIVVWCNAYSEMSDLNPVYYNENELILRDSTSISQTVLTDWYANGFRLPTEGEWQYAASSRGVTPQNYASGATDTTTDEMDRVSWSSHNSSSSSFNTGTKDANGLGIYDMSGNIWEYCYDYYAVNDIISKSDYRGPESGSYRTIRGGSINYAAPHTTIGGRYDTGYYSYANTLGFRLAQSQEEQLQ